MGTGGLFVGGLVAVPPAAVVGLQKPRRRTSGAGACALEERHHRPDDVASVEVAVLAQARTNTHHLDRVRADAIRPYRRENRLKQRGEHADAAWCLALLRHGVLSF